MGILIVGIGTDLIEINRIEKAISRHGSRFLKRIFSTAEREYSRRRFRPAESLAARFAAKEAVAKSLGLGLGAFAWREIEVLRTNTGAPTIRLHGSAIARAGQLGVTAVFVSLSHSKQYAVAQATAWAGTTI